jgi:hypothetical protein
VINEKDIVSKIVEEWIRSEVKTYGWASTI